MRPWLREGMRVQLEPIDLDRVRVGDVVAFALAGGLVAHRVIAIVRHAPVPVLRTKGDACIAADPPVRFEDVVGRVARVETSTRIIDLRTTRSRLAGLAIAGCSLMVAAARAVVGRLRARI